MEIDLSGKVWEKPKFDMSFEKCFLFIQCHFLW